MPWRAERPLTPLRCKLGAGVSGPIPGAFREPVERRGSGVARGYRGERQFRAEPHCPGYTAIGARMYPIEWSGWIVEQ